MHVQIRRFTCCLNMGLNLKILQMSPELLYRKHTVYRKTDHLTDAFVRENVAYGYDVVTFESLQPTPFCLEKSSVRKLKFLMF